ncbi:MAG: hypothetical protein NZO58_00380 [Gemmataceae bacterium]|nr:hypothetical protein [Gemmataceae bacterium]
MKMKMFALAALSLAGWAVSAAPASAWWWHYKHGINRYSTVIVCRPYNAFTPVCAGSLVCDGCCPFSCPHLPTGASCHAGICNPLLGLYAVAPHHAWHGQPLPGSPAPDASAPNFTPPPPQPGQAQLPVGYGQPHMAAGYHPGVYPVYHALLPTPTYPNFYQQAPAYWYGR